MRDRIFFDTNILVYLTDEKAEFHKSVSDVFEDIARTYDIWISRQVLREYAVVVSRKEFVEKPLRPDQIINDIARWGKIFRVIDETQGVTEHLKRLIFEYNLKGKIIHDANIVASMIGPKHLLYYPLKLLIIKSFGKSRNRALREGFLEKVPGGRRQLFKHL